MARSIISATSDSDILLLSVNFLAATAGERALAVPEVPSRRTYKINFNQASCPISDKDEIHSDSKKSTGIRHDLSQALIVAPDRSDGPKRKQSQE
jgi:hypothetical protein